ncbi:uroporphyrinogen-III synthase [Candidatus Parabeggiatoa sp. HSG14]|uniref:uroporphyrinogen-III synthase n=1 Tax=Candidatus Parabeggiatoa sp. HSG14 TaxID=3055593 RepID=UPI0025A7780B|nr:uroporphyrinogen-III synthase [Thiotrichales bacterium HSG14]
MLSKKLEKIKVLVTRPVHQSENLCQLIKAESGKPIRLPVIEIAEIADNSDLLDCRVSLKKLDIAIFISANAVEKTLPFLLENGNLPSKLQLIAVGKKTAKTIKKYGLLALCSVPPFNSETVLAMPQLQKKAVQDKQIVIFRGEGGRELLAETLRQRDAIVKYVNVYRRIQPPVPSWIVGTKIDVITLTSVEGLQNLFAMLEGQSWLQKTPLVVMSERIKAEAQKLGVQAPIFVAETASDEGLLSGILQTQYEKHIANTL